MNAQPRDRIAALIVRSALENGLRLVPMLRCAQGTTWKVFAWESCVFMALIEYGSRVRLVRRVMAAARQAL